MRSDAPGPNGDGAMDGEAAVTGAGAPDGARTHDFMATTDTGDDGGEVIDASTDAAACADGSCVREVCGDDIDNDDDGEVDCADPDCSSMYCVPAAPDGWSGPIALYDGSRGDVPAECPLGFSFEAYRGGDDLAWSPQECECGCGAPEGAACSAPRVSMWLDARCAGPPTVTAIASTSHALLVNQGSAYFIVGPTTAERGECTPVRSEQQRFSATFGRAALACQQPIAHQGGCGARAICAARAEEPFVDTLCVIHSGEVECPDANYLERRVYYEDMVDDRSCGACTCSDPPEGSPRIARHETARMCLKS
jgi:hypothetical protein